MSTSFVMFPTGHDAQCTHCGQLFGASLDDDYMLTDEAWVALHPEGDRGFLHGPCLAARAKGAGRVLQAQDFTECLCFVNRHIYFATPERVFGKLLQRLHLTELDLQRRKPEIRYRLPHFGHTSAQMLKHFALQDDAAVRFQQPSVFLEHFSADSPLKSLAPRRR